VSLSTDSKWGRGADGRLVGAPGMEELSLMLRGFLIKLTSLDGQLEDIKGKPTQPSGGDKKLTSRRSYIRNNSRNER
jgi:hypothetical protein